MTFKRINEYLTNIAERIVKEIAGKTLKKNQSSGRIDEKIAE